MAAMTGTCLKSWRTSACGASSTAQTLTEAADLPNSGRFVNDKVNSTINEADYYIVVLTADEELITGAFRPRPNASQIEIGPVT